MFNFFTSLEITVIVGVAAFVAGVVFSTKVKDFLKGVPGDVRTGLNGVEANVVANIKAAQARVIADLPIHAAKPVVTAAVTPPAA